MKLKHIINEVSVDVIRTAEIRKLLKEYDALDGVLLESNDARDVKIVVRLDELGLFDSMLSEKKSRAQRKAERAAEITANKNRKLQNRTPKDTPEELPDSSVDTQPVASPEDMKGPGGIRKLGSMLASALKGGKTNLVAKIKATINKVRGKAPNAPIKDVPGIPPEIAKAADTPSPETSTDTTEPSAEAPTTDSPVTDEPSADTTPSGDEAPTDTPSIEEPSADASPEKTPAKDEPLVSPDTVSKLQRNAGLTPSTPAPVDTPTGDAETPINLRGPKPPRTPEQQAAFDKFQKEKQAAVTKPTDEPVDEPVKTAEPSASPATIPPPPPPPGSPAKISPPPPPGSPAKSDTPKEEPTDKPNVPKFGTPEWTAARKQQLAAMSPEDKAKESEKALKRVGFTQTGTGGRGIGDRLGAAFRGLTAKAGEDLGKAGTGKPKYKSMFYEIAKRLHKMGALKEKFALHEWSRVFETAGYGPLGEYARYLSENTMDEEKYTLRELYAMMEEMQQLEQAHNWWHKPSEAEEDGHIEPSKVHETAISLEEMNAIRKAFATAAMGAALAGGAKDAGAQSTTPAAVPNDSVSTTVVRDLNRVGPAQNQNRMNLTGRKITPHQTAGTGVQSVTQNPDGTYSVTTDYREQKPKPKTESSSFSLEEILDEMED
jgi:hypothetical protein